MPGTQGWGAGPGLLGSMEVRVAPLLAAAAGERRGGRKRINVRLSLPFRLGLLVRCVAADSLP